MRLISIDKATNGDVLAQSILGPDGCPLLREGSSLSDRYVEKLREMGLAYIYVRHPKLEDIELRDMKFFEIKARAVKALANIFSRIVFNDTKNIPEVIEIVTEMVDYLTENRSIDAAYLLELKMYKNYLYIHSLNTCILGIFMGIELGYKRKMIIDLGIGMILLDIGNIKIPQQILEKNGVLTPEEFNLVSKHTQFGYDLVKNIGVIPSISKVMILEHHERVDGKGYPKRISSDSISKYGRIAAICDVYDAMISNKMYKKGFPLNEAYEYIMAGGGTLFDMEFVNVFRSSFSIYPVGAGVKLSDGTFGYVIKHNKGFPDRPVVRILYDKFDRTISPTDVNLTKKLDIRIEKMVV